MGRTIYYQKSFTKPIETEIFNNYVAMRSNIREEVFKSETSTLIQYVYEEQRLTLSEYIIELEKKQQQQWDTLEYLLKQTGDISQEII